MFPLSPYHTSTNSTFDNTPVHLAAIFTLSLWTLVFCAWFEALGYGLRVYAARDPSIQSFIFPTLFILLVPNALAFVNYQVLSYHRTIMQALPAES